MAFDSTASNLIAGDTNGWRDIFVRDIVKSTTTRVSIASDGSQANNNSFDPSISLDGRYVVFKSNASNLVGGDTNGVTDIFLRDVFAGTTSRVSVASAGTEANNSSIDPVVSGDGRFVAFASFASNLIPSDAGGFIDVFLRDTQAGTTTLVSKSSAGVQGNGNSGGASISGDGGSIAFRSGANNLLGPGVDTNGWDDAFARDASGVVTAVSRAANGDQGNGSSGFPPAMAPDASVAVFASDASNLVSGDTNAKRDVFASGPVVGGVVRASVSSAGSQANNESGFPPAVSARGRFVAFTSLATNLVASDANGAWDGFVRDTDAGKTERISLTASGGEANGGVGPEEIAISANGRYVAFLSTATNMGAGESGANADIYVRDRGYAIPLEQTFGLGPGGHAAKPNASWADPVNTATGNFGFSSTDASLPGIALPFVLTRAYNSLDTISGPLGLGWTHSYNVSLSIRWDGTASLRAEDGQQLVFTQQTDGTYQAVAGGRSTLVAVTGGYELKRSDQILYRFNSGGRLTSVEDRSGNDLALAYDGQNRLETVTDTAGRTHTFTYNGAGLLTSVTLPGGRVVSYGYTSGRLSSFTDLRGEVWSYAYDSSGRLSEITDPLGKRTVKNVYDADSRVVEQYDVFNNKTSFTYNLAAGTTTAEDPLGGDWVDTYDERGVLTGRSDALGNDLGVVFDASLNPTQVTDPLTKNWTLSFDSRGNLLSRTAPAPLSFSESWTYDAKNNPLTYTDARSNTWTYEYDSAGRLTKETVPGGSFRTFTYTAAGQVATITDFRSNTTSFTYDASGSLTEIETPLGHKTTYSYDTAGRVTGMVEPRGNEPGADPNDFKTTYTYDDAGNMLTETDPLGNATTYTYDAAGNLATRTDALNRVTTYTYNDAGELISEQAPGGRTTSYEYDDRGLLTAQIAPAGRKTTYSYNAAGRLASKVTPRGNVTGANPDDFRWTYGYDAAGRLTSITDPLGGIVAHAYDVAGRLTSTSDPRGKTTSFEYDANGNRTKITDPAGGATLYAYDSRNRLDTLTDPRGKITDYTHAANGNQTAVTTPLGNQRTFAYDADNGLESSVDPRGNAAGANPADYRWTFGHDAAGNQTSETDPLGNQRRWEFDRAGRNTKQIDALNHTTTYTFDAISRLTKVTAPDTSETVYGYDTPGDLTTRTDAVTHITSYEYDGAGRRTKTTSPLAQIWTYAYDAADNLIALVDAAGNATPSDPNDGTTAYTYDALDRRTATNYSDTTPDVTYGYDAAGNRTSLVDGQGSEVSVYDDAGRLTGVTRGLSVLAYEYDAAGNITKRTYPDATQVLLAYDDDSRLDSVTQGTATTDYSYDQAGSRILTQNANGTEESRTYDRAGRLSEVRHRKGATSFAFATYTRDAAGNPTQVLTQDGTTTYDYDDLDRLTEACFTATCTGIAPDGGDVFVRYAYDAVGNRLTEQRPLGTTTYTYNAADQLTQEQAPTGTTTYEYDPNGNQTRAGARTFAYDLANRLIRAEQLDGIFTYAYDGDGKRFETTQTNLLPPKTTNYAWDATASAAQLLLERDAIGTLVHRYVHGANLINQTSPDTVNPATLRTNTYHPDGIGSTTAVTDAAGDTDWRYTYDPYGKTRREARDDLLAPENRMRFTGELQDVETGLYHLRARQYDPNTGRFLTTDPLERETSHPYISAYAYADDRPTVLVDPSGLRGQSGPQEAFVPAPIAPAPPIVVPPVVPPGGAATGLCLANPVLCAGGLGVLGGVAIYEWDPFNYTNVFENLGANLYDWFAGEDENNDKYVWRAGKKQRGNYRPRPIDLDTGLSVATTALQAMAMSGKKEAWGLGRIDILTSGFFIRADPSTPGHYFIFLADHGEMKRWSNKDDPKSTYWTEKLIQTAREYVRL